MSKVRKARLSTLPTASGGIARAAYAHALEAGLDAKPLLKGADLTVAQARNSAFRMPVRAQIKFLNLVAAALHDEFLGIRLAQNVELRSLGYLYYVLASSETLGDALKRLARYTGIQNEGVRVAYSEGKEIPITVKYVGVARLSDRHQIECMISILLRICQQITGRHLAPSRVRFMHSREKFPAKLKAFFGCEVEFGSDLDEIAFPGLVASIPVVNADPFLNSLLVKYYDEALTHRPLQSGVWRLSVENTIVPLLPHGQADIAQVAQRLGISKRTLSRRLESEGFTFAEILSSLRFDLAKRYLGETTLPISQVAWLLGYRETSAFHHAFRRWSEATPKQMRQAGRA